MLSARYIRYGTLMAKILDLTSKVGWLLGFDRCCELMGVALPIVLVEKLLGRHN
jgi:hypothetical protein